jgi:hypothetical protein
MNLPVLMAGSDQLNPGQTVGFDPRSIDWEDRRSAVSFVSSDGDNVQWYEGNFFQNNSYWNNPGRGRHPFGCSCCFVQLSQLCPMAIEHALATRKPNDWFIEWGGGYYYPDLFGRERPDGRQLLAHHARHTWELMRKTNTRIIGFNVSRPASADALKAYATFASQTDGLVAILVFQYSPYEGGEGRVYWVADRAGVEIPVITARYSIWAHSNDRPRSGTPARVAHEIDKSVMNAPAAELPRYDWVIDHVWSYFRQAPGSDEDAENMPQRDDQLRGGVRGLTPVQWCAEGLPASIRVVCPEELAWRVRMKHNAAATMRVINEFATR